MRSAVHVIPCAGILADLDRGPGLIGSGIATAALRTAERLEAPADLVLLAVPAGQGQAIADKLAASDRGPGTRPGPARYLSESEEDLDEVMRQGGRPGDTHAHGRRRR